MPIKHYTVDLRSLPDEERSSALAQLARFIETDFEPTPTRNVLSFFMDDAELPRLNRQLRSCLALRVP